MISSHIPLNKNSQCAPQEIISRELMRQYVQFKLSFLIHCTNISMKSISTIHLSITAIKCGAHTPSFEKIYCPYFNHLNYSTSTESVRSAFAIDSLLLSLIEAITHLL